MKSIRSTLVVSLFFLLFTTASAFATCPTIASHTCCGVSWYEFDVDSSCLSSSGVSGATLSCSMGGYEYNTGLYDSASWSFTVPADNTSISNGGTYGLRSSWTASVWVDFNSPTSSFYDNINGTLTVTHGGSNTNYGIFSFYGNYSSSQSCSRQDVAFSATNGDTITVTISATRGDSAATIKATEPIIFNQ